MRIEAAPGGRALLPGRLGLLSMVAAAAAALAWPAVVDQPVEPTLAMVGAPLLLAMVALGVVVAHLADRRAASWASGGAASAVTLLVLGLPSDAAVLLAAGLGLVLGLSLRRRPLSALRVGARWAGHAGLASLVGGLAWALLPALAAEWVVVLGLPLTAAVAWLALGREDLPRRPLLPRINGPVSGSAIALLLALTAATVPPLLALWPVVLMVGWRYRRRSLAAAEHGRRLELLYRFSAELAPATRPDAALLRTARSLGDILQAGAVDLLWLDARHRGLRSVELREQQVSCADDLGLDARLLLDWLRSDTDPRVLGPEDSHPLRAWLRARGVADAIVVPITRPEVRGVAVIGNRPATAASFSAADAVVANMLVIHAIEALHRVMDQEVDGRLMAELGPAAATSIHDVTGLPSNDAMAEYLPGFTHDTTSHSVLATVAVGRAGPEGRALGRDLEIALARRLRMLLAGTDLLFHRHDGTFVLFMRNVSSVAAAVSRCDDLVREMRRPIDLGGTVVDVACAVGIAAVPNDLPPTRAGEAARAASETAAARAAVSGASGVVVHRWSARHRDVAS